MPDTATATPDPTDIDAYLSKRGMMTYPQIDAKRQELIGQYETAGEKESAGIEQGAAARKKLMGGGIPSPGAPKLQDLPAPPDNQPQSPFQAFGSPAVFLASIGSLFTRHPLKVAMDSAAAAMKGYHEGDQQTAQAQQERWKEATETAIKQNQVELEKYNAAWKSTEHDVAERQAKMQAIAAGVQDEVMLAAIKTGNLDRVWHMLDSRQQANDKLQEAMLHERDRQETIDIQRKRLEAQTGQHLDDATLHRMAEQYIAGDRAVRSEIAGGMSGYADKRALANMVTKVMEEQGKTPRDMVIATAELGGLKREEAAVGGRAGNIALAVQEAQDAMPILITSSRAAPRNGYAIWNQLENKWEVQRGSPEYAQFITNLNSMINIYGRAISGASRGTVSDLEHAREMLNPNQPIEAFEASLKGMQQEMDIAENSPAKVVEQMRARWSGKTKPTETTFSPSTSDQPASTPPASILKEGQPTTVRNKKTGAVETWTLQNGQPVKVK